MNMRRIRLLVLVGLTLFCFLGTALAQRGGGGKAKKRIKDLEVVISEVGKATISYQVESRGRLRTRVVGIADVTRIQKRIPDNKWQKIKLKDLQRADKALITLYQDPEDPYFPALSVRVIGKGELKKRRRGGRGGRKGKRR